MREATWIIAVTVLCAAALILTVLLFVKVGG